MQTDLHTHHLRTVEDLEKNLKTTNTFIELDLWDAVSAIWKQFLD